MASPTPRQSVVLPWRETPLNADRPRIAAGAASSTVMIASSGADHVGSRVALIVRGGGRR